MPTNGSALYLDSSALVKLVVSEPESSELLRFLSGHPLQVSSALAKVEVIRAVQPEGRAAVARAERVLRTLLLLRLDDELLDLAAELPPSVLRTLDAIHVASAQTLGRDLDRLVTYDGRMFHAAELLGIPVIAPGRLPRA